jgi:glucose-6-phosphate isomerase
MNPLNRDRQTLPAGLEAAVGEAIQQWQAEAGTRRLWARDTTLWTGGDEDRWLGWLDIVGQQHENLDHLHAVAEDTRGFGHALLLGMGGSSLCPEVLGLSFGKQLGHPELLVLDSTDSARIRALESRVDLADCLVYVSSKSGTTTEPNVLLSYFHERVKERVGATDAGSRFIAITDPGSALEKLASERGFRHVLHGVPGIGGRYSALSHFGMVPAAVMGLDVDRFLDRAKEMVEATAAGVPAADNPGVRLGVVLGVAARSGRDKLTLVTSPGIGDLGAWIEQLVAESTGKQGKGIIPVDGERPGPAETYGDDRLFVYLRLESAPDVSQDEAVAALEQAGQPVVRIDVAEPHDLGQEFFRWELATAVAGSILGINPFDQPDVEASKIETRKLLEDYERSGKLAPETPVLQQDGFKLYTDPTSARELAAAAGADADLTRTLRAHLARLGSGDYLALLAYLEMSPQNDEPLQAMRHAVRDARRVATCLGYGPRFLHSTGQVYKGGPNTGVFLQLTTDDAEELTIPGQSYGFGVVKAAQARGDFQVLAQRERRALRVHLPQPVAASLARLAELVKEAVS